MTPPTTAPGWAFPTAEARKCHYFRPRESDKGMARSLCGKYGYFYRAPGAYLMSDSGKKGPDDCAGCRRKLEKAA